VKLLAAASPVRSGAPPPKLGAARVETGVSGSGAWLVGALTGEEGPAEAPRPQQKSSSNLYAAPYMNAVLDQAAVGKTWQHWAAHIPSAAGCRPAGAVSMAGRPAQDAQAGTGVDGSGAAGGASHASGDGGAAAGVNVGWPRKEKAGGGCAALAGLGWKGCAGARGAVPSESTGGGGMGLGTGAALSLGPGSRSRGEDACCKHQNIKGPSPARACRSVYSTIPRAQHLSAQKDAAPAIG
jgi:hypothetical protein